MWGSRSVEKKEKRAIGIPPLQPLQRLRIHPLRGRALRLDRLLGPLAEGLEPLAKSELRGDHGAGDESRRLVALPAQDLGQRLERLRKRVEAFLDSVAVRIEAGQERGDGGSGPRR